MVVERNDDEVTGEFLVGESEHDHKREIAEVVAEVERDVRRRGEGGGTETSGMDIEAVAVTATSVGRGRESASLCVLASSPDQDALAHATYGLSGNHMGTPFPDLRRSQMDGTASVMASSATGSPPDPDMMATHASASASARGGMSSGIAHHIDIAPHPDSVQTADDSGDRPKRKRNIYSTEEERRMARILKNRRTAEESRQRRLQKMKELEALAAGADEREKKLRAEITELRGELAVQMAQVKRLQCDLHVAREEADKLRMVG
uniref:BZIP domain-containing protein n=1 Tax=Compsopogon caeruleus TaxID=31354 RepID=A0A7S1TI31_9RHOD